MSQGVIDYYLGNLIVPLQVICVFVSFVLLIISNSFLKKGYIPLLLGGIILFCIIFANFHRMNDINDLLKFFQVVTGMMIYFIAMHLSLYDSWLTRLLKVLFIMVCLNALFGIKEILESSPLPWSCFYLSKLYGAKIYREAVGLDWFPVALGYSLVCPVTMAVILSLYGTKVSANPGKILSAITGVLGILLIIFSYSRSALLAVIAGVFAAVLFNVRKFNLISGGLLLSFLCIFMISIPLIQTYRKIDFAKDPRIIDNFKTYLPIIIANPLANITQNESAILEKAQNLYGIKVDGETRENALSISSPHNSILTIGVTYGFIPMAALILLYLYLFVIALRILFSKTVNSEVRFMISLFLSSFIAFVVHSHFHNAGLFLGEMRNWMYVGILVRFSLYPNLSGEAGR